MKISVVIPCHNAERSLERALASVLEQGVADSEILIVDDASTDGTVALAERLGARIGEFRLIRLEAKAGAAAARNAGLAQARGEYVAFLDPDDAYGEGVFAKINADFELFPWADGIEFGLRLVNAHREVHAEQLAIIAGSIPGSVVVRRAFARAIGGFPIDAEFHGRHAGEGIAFRLALRRWGTVGATSQVHLDHTVQRGGPFDRFMDSTRMVGDRLEYLPPDDDSLAADRAVGVQLQRVDAAMLRAIGDPRRHAIKCDMGGRTFDFEVPDRPEMIGEATTALARSLYPALPFLGPVQTILVVAGDFGATAIHYASSNPAARVIALEPARRGFVLLRRNAWAHPNLETYRTGLFDATTRLELPEADGGGSEQVQMAHPAVFLKSLRVDQLDVVSMDDRGCEVAALHAMTGYLPRIKAILVRYRRDTDRRIIDSMLTPTHMLYWGKSTQPNQGEFLYVRRTLLGADGER
jgi:glycosyltransferase involved in cell wall biosynthesis